MNRRTKILGSAAVLVILLGGVWTLAGQGSPTKTAVQFVEALPTNTATLRQIAPAMMQGPSLPQYILRWKAQDAAAGWHKEQGPVYAELGSQGPLGVNVTVVDHYVEVNRDGHQEDWEQVFSLNVARSGLHWQVVSARTTVVGIVEPMAFQGSSGPTNLIVPPEIYVAQPGGATTK